MIWIRTEGATYKNGDISSHEHRTYVCRMCATVDVMHMKRAIRTDKYSGHAFRFRQFILATQSYVVLCADTQ